MKEFCNNCKHCSDRHHELDPLGEWKWCELHTRDVHEDSETCIDWEADVRKPCCKDMRPDPLGYDLVCPICGRIV